MNNSQAWIKAGYDVFAREGYEGVHVERIARILNLNKSGFYHYFHSRFIFFEHLIQHHYDRVALMVQDIENVHTFDPDYLEVMINHQVTVMFNKQLIQSRHSGLFEEALCLVNDMTDRATVPLWASFLSMSDQPELALRYFQLIRDVVYARITWDNFNPEFLRGIASEAKAIIEGTVMRKHFSLNAQEIKSEFFSYISRVS